MTALGATRPTRRLGPTGSHIVTLTAAKTVANAALRWVGPFLPTLERAFGASTGALTSVLGVAELGGLTTTVSGPALDRGHQRAIFVAGLAAVAASSALAMVGSLAAFAVAFAILVVGVSNLTVAGHAWISHRVAYTSRSRAIGAFELSWALSLLVGAPLIALAVKLVGWRGPFALFVVGALVGIVVVSTRVPPDDVIVVRVPRRDRVRPPRLPASAWARLSASALTAASGMAVFVISGTWLSERHDVSTAGLGLVAMAFGALELVATSTSAMFADRLGKRPSVAAGLAGTGVGIALMGLSGDSAALAIAGLIVFLTGFEYAFVTSLALMSEAAPGARGRALGIGNAVGTIARSVAVLATGRLYEAFGMGASLGLAAAASVVAVALVAISND